MNEYQQKMYDDLMRLADTSESFYYADRDLDDGAWYRIFNYRMCSYTEFLAPNALECRGHMFEITEEGILAEPIRLASLPMQKFFNLYENPFTMDLDLTEIESAMLKADGSLISTYMHDDYIQLKTKGSLISDQCIAAKMWLNLPENESFKNELTAAERLGYTVNMEWCAPDNRIVLPYESPHLVVLNVRSREDGSYFKNEDIDTYIFPEILSRWVEYEELDDAVQFVKDIPDMQGIEGYVVVLPDIIVKVKTTWYLALHHTKDSINSPRRLFEAVLEEATDDMRSLFHDDPLALKTIEDMEKFVEVRYNHLVDSVERFYERNKEMERKEYAILGQENLDRTAFGLAMSKYLTKPVNYKEFMKKNWKSYGVKDEVKEDGDV